MDYQMQHKDSTGSKKVMQPVEFIAICGFVFFVSVLATAYFCSMCCDMKMPGGWAMSMMWMRMPGQTWVTSALSFMLMWLAMMVAMMLPSALPMFLKTRQKWSSLCYMASGYFMTWLVAGIAIYLPGILLMRIAMRSELVSHSIPLLSGASLIVAGAIQFTAWKKTQLLRCRSPFGCTFSSAHCETGFRLGCRQGATCCFCCLSPMAVLLTLGMMNPLVIIAVAIIIAAEKLLPRPEITARVVGVAAIFSGGIMIMASSGF